MPSIKVSDIPISHYQPILDSPFSTAPAPSKVGLKNINNLTYFNNYRNENLSKFQMQPYEWGFINSEYMPKPDSRIQHDLSKYLKLPKPDYTMLDVERMGEIDNFYKVAQMQRAKLRDDTGAVHPMAYFRSRELNYQCAPDPTSTYFQFPHYYTKYRDPLVLPITLDRTNRSPMLPIRALTGKYSPQSDICYKK